MAGCLSKCNQDWVQWEQGSFLCEKDLVSSCSACVYLKTEHILEMTSYCLLTFSESRALLASLGSSRACCQHSTWREVWEDCGHGNSSSVSLEVWDIYVMWCDVIYLQFVPSARQASTHCSWVYWANTRLIKTVGNTFSFQAGIFLYHC